MTENEHSITPDTLAGYQTELDELRYARHTIGASEYGPIAFVGNDMFQFAKEEIADTMNYMLYLFMKLRALEDQLNASGIDLSTLTAEDVRKVNPLPFDSSSFMPSEEVSGFLPNKER